MDAIPDLAKKTSINSLLNPEASSTSGGVPYTGVNVPPHLVGVGVGVPGADVYGAPSYANAGSSFGLRAASWAGGHGHDDRRRAEQQQQQQGRHAGQYGTLGGVDVYGRMGREREDPGYGGGGVGAAGMWGGHSNNNNNGYGQLGMAGMSYSDERTALSGDYTPYAQHRMADDYPPAYSDQWQLTERASARLVARDSRYAAAYYNPQPYPAFHDTHVQQHAPQPPPQPQPQPQPAPQTQTPRVVQPPLKRRSPIDEPDTQAPKPKRTKATSAAPKTQGTSKRGYPAKKRNDAQIAAQNAKPMTQLSYAPKHSEKGKEKPNAVTTPLIPLGPHTPSGGGPALHAEPQSTRCMSTKYKNDPFPRCVACTRRWAGDTCRFQGIRYFLRDEEGRIVGVTFSEMQRPDLPSLRFPEVWNERLRRGHVRRIKKTIAKALLPTLLQELAHLRQETIIHRPREREVRATCDTCMTSLFSSSWLCRLCGREACADCFSTICDLTADVEGMTPEERRRRDERRERYVFANPFFLQCTKRVEHASKEFSPMSRFCLSELEEAIGEMEGLVREEEEQEQQRLRQANGMGYPHPAPAPAAPELPTPLPTPPFIPPYLSHKTRSIPTLPIAHYAPTALTPASFPLLWASGTPLVVVGLLERFKIQWTPEYFVRTYGAQSCLVIECQTEVNRRVTVGEFFERFGRYEGRVGGSAIGSGSGSGSGANSNSNLGLGLGGEADAGRGARSAAPPPPLGRPGEVWKLKDWPPSMDFKKAFPELWEDFGGAVPVPSYVRRDGVMNLASHFPEDTVAPDIGPKMYNAMATTQEAGSKGSTRLHMDMADALNIMTYAAPAPDGSPGCAAWDLFRAEDSDKIRAFLAEYARSSANANANANSSSGSGSPGNGNAHGNGNGNGNANGSGGKEARVDWTANDPIHGQQFYLDEEMRERLYLTTGVRSYRFYQRPGEAVFIPAGCAHQVANLADCIKVAVDFVSPENVERCERLTREFREQNQRKMWKEDVLQLRTMMWFAWLSCRHQETKGEGEGEGGSEDGEGEGDE